MIRLTIAMLLLMTISASALEITINDVLPCKLPAIRFCHKGMSMYECSAKLVEKKEHLGNSCLNVLRRFGQL